MLNTYFFTRNDIYVCSLTPKNFEVSNFIFEGVIFGIFSDVNVRLKPDLHEMYDKYFNPFFWIVGINRRGVSIMKFTNLQSKFFSQTQS